MPDIKEKESRRLYETRFSFGATSAIMTTLALIVGLNKWVYAKPSIIAGILVIAVADNIADSMGIHVYQESECLTKHEVWYSTCTNFLTRLLVSLSFIVPIVMFRMKIAVIASIVWGLLLLAFLSYWLARHEKVNPIYSVLEHLGIAGVIIVLSSLIGKWISMKLSI